MKVLGGIIGLIQQPDALNRFCLTAPVLSSLGEEFLERNNICSYDRKHHYQITGSTCERIHSNIHKLLTVMKTFSVGFGPSEEVSNLVSKAVLPPLVSKELLRHEKIGYELYHDFISNRLNGELSIWLPMKKCNLKTFKMLKKTSKLKIGDRIIELKEEKNLMTRFLVTARKRPELELELCIGNYEFSVIPKSLFTVGGHPLPCTDKAKLMHHVEDLSISTDPSITLIQQNSAVVIDGMAVVNEIITDKSMKTCKVSYSLHISVVMSSFVGWNKIFTVNTHFSFYFFKDFADRFVDRIARISSGFEQVRLVFDRYVKDSLKARTRHKRTSGNEIRYQVSDVTNIENITLKQFLSHIDTKQDLTNYLTKYAKDHLHNRGKKYVVTHDLTSESNIVNYADDMKSHDHEEADTLLILQAINIAKTDPFTECVVYSPDTDVFLLLVHYSPLLPQVGC